VQGTGQGKKSCPVTVSGVDTSLPVQTIQRFFFESFILFSWQFSIE
jgi:hypothetical protein